MFTLQNWMIFREYGPKDISSDSRSMWKVRKWLTRWSVQWSIPQNTTTLTKLSSATRRTATSSFANASMAPYWPMLIGQTFCPNTNAPSSCSKCATMAWSNCSVNTTFTIHCWRPSIRCRSKWNISAPRIGCPRKWCSTMAIWSRKTHPNWRKSRTIWCWANTKHLIWTRCGRITDTRSPTPSSRMANTMNRCKMFTRKYCRSVKCTNRLDTCCASPFTHKASALPNSCSLPSNS